MTTEIDKRRSVVIDSSQRCRDNVEVTRTLQVGFRLTQKPLCVM